MAAEEQTLRYPEDRSPFLRQVNVQDQEFAELREAFLLGYGYNTARAYWGDLQDIYDWAVARNKNVLHLSEQDIRQYVALLRRRKYSENTIRRRRTAWRGFLSAIRIDYVSENLDENPEHAVEGPGTSHEC